MAAHIIDGRAIAQQLRQEVALEVKRLRQLRGLTPGLAVVLVGQEPASQVYVATKIKQTREAGMLSIEHQLPADTAEDTLLGLIAELNQRQDVHGILVQLPLPKHIASTRVIEAIDPAKDVDGFHPINVGRLATGAKAFAPCTPTGCLMLAKSLGLDLAGLEAVVVGRSNIVGKPMAQLLLNENCTPTLAHSHTRDLPSSAVPTWSWRRWAGPSSSRRAGSNPAPSSSTSAFSVWRMAARHGSWATWLSRKWPRWRAQLHRSRAAWGR